MVTRARERPAGFLAAPEEATVASPAPVRVAGEATPARSLRAVELVTASALMALGGVVLVAAVRMGIGWGSDGPESGFVPFWLSTVLIGSCAITTVQAARRASGKRFATREQLRCVMTVVLPAAAMIVLTQLVGLYVASAVYMGFSMRWGRHSWLVSLALPPSFAIFVFLVFERWFLVPLPKGPLEAWLGY
jgi:hypothetical protein